VLAMVELLDRQLRFDLSDGHKRPGLYGMRDRHNDVAGKPKRVCGIDGLSGRHC
jgi:hypothetical protein